MPSRPDLRLGGPDVPLIALDLLAFMAILVTAWRKRANTHPGIPSLLETIRRDATLYFIVIFGCQVLVELFSLFAPVGDM